MVSLTQAHVDEDKRLRQLQHTWIARLKPLPLPRVVEEKKPQNMRPDDAAARLGDIPGAVVHRKTVKRRR